MKKKFLYLVTLLLLTLLIHTITSDTKTFADDHLPAGVTYRGHSQSVGWQESVSNGTMAGTTGRNLRLEAFSVNLEGIDGTISYRSYVEGSKWQNYVSNGGICGTVGQSKNMYAVQMHLSGNAANQYDLYYQVHKSNIGWTGWVRSGTELGTNSLSNKIEAIQILILPKGSAAPANIPATVNSVPTVYYSGHVTNIGWQDYSYGDGTAGTTQQGLQLEAMKIKVDNASDKFGIEYAMYSGNGGWQDWVSNDETAGATGVYNITRSIKIRLIGYMSANYSVYYRTYSSDGVWSDWAHDGEKCGKTKSKDMLQAIQVKIVRKGTVPSSSILPIASVTPITLQYRTHVQNEGWQNYKYNHEITGTTGQAKRVEAFSLSFSGVTPSQLGIKYRAYVQNKGWLSWVNDGSIAGTTGQAKRVEAIQIELTGSLAKNYDIYYRTHCQNLGWLDWTYNGNIAGTTDMAYRIEAIQIVVLPKGAAAPGTVGTAYIAKTYSGIDVSRWQGDIDWTKVAASGIQFAMVRVQYGTTKDNYYQSNLKNASNAGLSVGAYCYSIATNVEEAKNEALSIVNALKGYNITYPVAYDIEDNYYQGNLSNRTRTDMVLAFKKIIEDNGYQFVLYANKNWIENKLNYKELSGVDIWFARYRDYQTGFDNPNDQGSDKILFPASQVTMWQYTSQGTIPGITGSVDMNVSYKSYHSKK